MRARARSAMTASMSQPRQRRPLSRQASPAAPEPANDPEPESPILVELRKLDVNGLTPLAALTLLHEWKKIVSAQ